MSSVDILCPFCDLRFEASNVDPDDEEVTCEYCEQDISIEVEVELNVDVNEITEGESYEAKRETAKKSKLDMFIIHLGTDSTDNYYTEYGIYVQQIIIKMLNYLKMKVGSIDGSPETLKNIPMQNLKDTEIV